MNSRRRSNTSPVSAPTQRVEGQDPRAHREPVTVIRQPTDLKTRTQELLTPDVVELLVEDKITSIGGG